MRFETDFSVNYCNQLETCSLFTPKTRVRNFDWHSYVEDSKHKKLIFIGSFHVRNTLALNFTPSAKMMTPIHAKLFIPEYTQSRL